MNALDALLAALLDTPADDARRLVFADALEESGAEAHAARAELIRLQVADEGHDRQQELLDRWLKAWLPAALTADGALRPTHAHGEWWRCQMGRFVAVTRGFVSAIRLTDPLAGGYRWDAAITTRVADVYALTVEALFAQHPLERVIFGLVGEQSFDIWYGSERRRIIPEPMWSYWVCGTGRGWLCKAETRDELGRGLSRVVRDRVLSFGKSLPGIDR